MLSNSAGSFFADAIEHHQKSSPWLARDWQEPGVRGDLLRDSPRIATKRRSPRRDQRSPAVVRWGSCGLRDSALADWRVAKPTLRRQTGECAAQHCSVREIPGP